jgi:hypothetical protein
MFCLYFEFVKALVSNVTARIPRVRRAKRIWLTQINETQSPLFHDGGAGWGVAPGHELSRRARHSLRVARS